MNNDKELNPILANGVSEEGFANLLANIKTATIEDSCNSLNNYNEMIDELRKTKPGEKTENWITSFQNQVSYTNQVINEKYQEIEDVFKQMDIDWKQYNESGDK